MPKIWSTLLLVFVNMPGQQASSCGRFFYEYFKVIVVPQMGLFCITIYLMGLLCLPNTVMFQRFQSNTFVVFDLHSRTQIFVLKLALHGNFIFYTLLKFHQENLFIQVKRFQSGSFNSRNIQMVGKAYEDFVLLSDLYGIA